VIELEIESIRVSIRHGRRVVILKETEAERYLTIWISGDTAEAIALRLQDITVVRPQTHDLLSNVMQELGGTVKSVVVNDLKDDTFFARINVEQDGRMIEIDSRPSDAIALAVRARVPIFVEEHVLESAGIRLDSDGAERPSDHAGAGDRPIAAVTDEEREKLSAFYDVVGDLDLDVLGGND